MRSYPRPTAIPRQATAGLPKRLRASITPPGPRTGPGRLGAQSRVPVQCLLLLILLCPLAAAVGQAIPPPPGGGGPYPSYKPLDSWSFNDTTNWTSDNGYAPVSFTNITGARFFGDYTSLVVNSNLPAWLQYNVLEDDGTTNLTVDVGSVALWFAPAWAGTNAGGTGPGQWGRLLEVGGYTADASFGWWSLYVDDVGANLYFTVQPGDGSTTTYLTAPINWTSNYWHFIALTYSATNTALYLDGALATNGPGLTAWPGTNVLAGGFYIGSDSNGVLQAAGAFDDLLTYNVQLDSGTVYETFRSYWPDYYLMPYNSIGSAPSSPSTNAITSNFVAISGLGNLTPISTNTLDCVSSSAVWMTNVVATLLSNGTMNLAFTISGGSNGWPYDVFATAALAYPITNAQWGWMGQGYQCTRYLLTNLPPSSALLILGTPLDSDGDGLTDAYELLVSHTDPHNPDSSGDGMLDGWKVLWGLNASINNAAQPGLRSNFAYDPVGRLDLLSGIRGETLTNDFEGNILQAR